MYKRQPRGGEGEYREDSGRAPAAVLRRGSHITLVSYGVEINDVLQAARLLEERGVEAEVVKLNIITPLDAAPVLDSVRRTGALLVAEDSVSAGSVGERLACALEQAGISARGGAVQLRRYLYPPRQRGRIEAAPGTGRSRAGPAGHGGAAI